MKKKTFHKVTPFIPVTNLKETFEFYKKHLGFSQEWTWGEVDGGIQRDEMRLLFEQDPAYVKEINHDRRAFQLIWFVDNVDEIYEEYREKKIPIVSALKNEPWGVREFTIKDNNGYLIRISESV